MSDQQPPDLPRLDPELCALLDAERAAEDPPQEAVDRMYHRLATALALPMSPSGLEAGQSMTASGATSSGAASSGAAASMTTGAATAANTATAATTSASNLTGGASTLASTATTGAAATTTTGGLTAMTLGWTLAGALTLGGGLWWGLSPDTDPVETPAPSVQTQSAEPAPPEPAPPEPAPPEPTPLMAMAPVKAALDAPQPETLPEAPTAAPAPEAERPVSRKPAPRQPASRRRAKARRPRRPARTRPAPAVAAAPAHVEAVPPPAAEPPAPEPPPAPILDTRLARESALLSRAHQALRTGQAPLTLRLADEHRRHFPRGQHLADLALLRVKALAALARWPEAERAAERFLDHHTGHPAEGQVKLLLKKITSR